jgi:hypothetical protein
MKKNLILNILFASLFVCTIVACKRNAEPDTTAGKIAGTWKLTKTATDDNGSGVIENYEMHAVPSIQDYQLLFRSDGSGVSTNTYDGVKSPDLTFIWQSNADQLLVAYKANDTISYFLVNVNSKELVLSNTVAQGLQWYYYTKH